MEFFSTVWAVGEFGCVLQQGRGELLPEFLTLRVQTRFFSFGFHKEIPLFLYLCRLSGASVNNQYISKRFHESKAPSGQPGL